jgi:hypothetical protein
MFTYILIILGVILVVLIALSYLYIAEYILYLPSLIRANIPFTNSITKNIIYIPISSTVKENVFNLNSELIIDSLILLEIPNNINSLSINFKDIKKELPVYIKFKDNIFFINITMDDKKTHLHVDKIDYILIPNIYPFEVTVYNSSN